MAVPGSYRIASRARAFEAHVHPALRSERRVQRILDSLRAEICGVERRPLVRVRRIFSTPREIFRLEIADPAQGYQRTTLLDRDTLDELLEWDEVRERVQAL